MYCFPNVGIADFYFFTMKEAFYKTELRDNSIGNLISQLLSARGNFVGTNLQSEKMKIGDAVVRKAVHYRVVQK